MGKMGKLWGKTVGLTQLLITVANNNTNPINLIILTYPYYEPHTCIPHFARCCTCITAHSIVVEITQLRLKLERTIATWY